MTSLGHNELKQNMSWRHVNSFPWHWKTARLPGHMPIKSDLLHLTGKLWITLYFFSVWSRTPTMSSSWPPWLLVMLPRVPRNPSIWVSSRWEETFYPNICPWFCYASAFRRRRHYVFGLSVRPSVRPKPEIPSFDLYMGPLVHPTNRNRFTACPSVRLMILEFWTMMEYWWKKRKRFIQRS